MHLTEEQKRIVQSNGDIKINAVAGSGKTSTLIEYARQRADAKRILYLAFNRSVRVEAQRRFAEEGLGNVDVQTAHSLAFRHVVPRCGYEVRNGYKAHEIKELLGLESGAGDPHAAWLLASHVGRLTSLYCNHAAERVADLDYASTVEDEKSAAFARHHAVEIIESTRQLLAKMDRAEIPVTHEFYLKKFQLGKPRLAYDYILFDEGQDASPVMLDVFLSQAGGKVIVGDVHQQIYGWRYAVNALSGVHFADLPLTTSFRFGPLIAALAVECLGWKRHLGLTQEVRISGLGKPGKQHSHATLARTNLALLKRAIEAVSGRNGMQRLYFEGNLSSYTYAAEGANIYDVLGLYTGSSERIRDPLIRTFSDFAQLEEYAEQAADMELSMLIDIVSEYGRELPRLLKLLRERHVEDADRAGAQMVFSTVHRCKGMEYDDVTLTDDFMTEDRLAKLVAREGLPALNADRLAEEVNLAYVAITRTRGGLHVPDGMFPGRVEPRPLVTDFAPRGARSERPSGRPLPPWFARQRRTSPNAGKSWTKADDAELTAMYRAGKAGGDIAVHFGRNPGAISSRLRKLGLTE
jgi:superfamily I DNA/RNA helicase